MHLLQHKLQILHPSLLIRLRRQQFTVDEFCRDFRRLFSSQLQHHLGLLDHCSEECPRLLRPLLDILFFAREFLRTTQAIHLECLSELELQQGCRLPALLFAIWTREAI